MIIQDDLKTRLNREFDYSDGELIRKPGIKVRPESPHVWKEDRKYLFAGKQLTLKQFIWIFHYGNIPEGKRIDFKTGSSHRIENLFLTPIRKHPEPTQKECKDIFDYDYLDGNLIWEKGRCKGQNVKGSKSRSGHLLFTVLGKTHTLHRIIWIFHNGAIEPGMQIHHKNHNKSDNRIENLDLLTSKEHGNAHRSDMPANNTTGHVHINRLKDGRWRISTRHGIKSKKGEQSYHPTKKECIDFFHNLHGYDLCNCTPPENEESKADQMELFQNIDAAGVIAGNDVSELMSDFYQ